MVNTSYVGTYGYNQMASREGDEYDRAAVPLMTFQRPDDSDFMQSDEEEDPLESVLNRMKYRPQIHQPHDFWPSILLSGGLCLVLGFVISYVAFVVGQRSISEHQTVVKELNHALGASLGQLVSQEKINSFSQMLQKEGMTGEVSRLHQHFVQEGFDNAYTFNYTTLTFKPDPQYTNKVSLITSAGDIHMTVLLNASTTFSISSDNIMTELVYIGAGRAEDWLAIEEANIAVQDKILIASTNILYPEDIAKASYERGAAALLLYSPHKQDFPFWFPHSVTPGVGGLYQESQGFQLPVAAMSAQDAEKLLRISMTSVDDASGFQEGIPNKAKHGSLRIHLHTLPHISPIFNEVAVFGGAEQPDRYVIIGAHRTESRNGTAALMELARVFGTLKTSKGWRPKRTLIIASWGGDGVTGAANFVSQFQQTLRARAVAYIDIHHTTRDKEDSLIQGSPLLQQLLTEISPLLPDLKPLLNQAKPELQLPGHRSNCPAFLHATGTPCLSLLFSNHSTLVSSVKVGGIAAWFLADTSLLPYDMTSLSKALASSVAKLNSLYDAMLMKHNLTIRSLDSVLSRLAVEASRFQEHLDKTTIHTNVQLRELNDQLHQLGNSLLLPMDSELRDVYLWPSSVSESNSGIGFGPLQDLLAACASPSHDSDHERALKLQHHTAQLTRLIESAAKLLITPTQLA